MLFHSEMPVEKRKKKNKNHHHSKKWEYLFEHIFSVLFANYLNYKLINEWYLFFLMIVCKRSLIRNNYNLHIMEI